MWLCVIGAPGEFDAMSDDELLADLRFRITASSRNSANRDRVAAHGTH